MALTVRPFVDRLMARCSVRSRSVGLFFATSIAARAIGVCCQLAQVPIAIKVLGSEAFGLWMALVSAGYVITFADFGVGQGAQNRLAEAFAVGDEGRAREIGGSACSFLFAVALLLGACVVLVVPRIDISAFFRLTDPHVRLAAGPAVVIALVLYCANFPLGMAQRIAYSRQRGWLHNIALAAGSVGSLGGLVLATRLRWGLGGIVAATQAPSLAANAILLAGQLGALGWLKPSFFRCRWATTRGLLGLGAYFGVQQVLLVLMVSLPQILISACLGAAAVTPYNLVQRLFNLFAIIQNAFMIPLWPAYSDAKARGDFGWIRRTLGRSLRATLFLTIGPMAVGALSARPIIAVWVGNRPDLPPAGLVWLLFFWNAAVFVQQPFGYLLAGISVVRRLTCFAVVSTLASASLMAVFIRRFGEEGAVFGLLVGYLPFLLFGNVIETFRVLRSEGLGEAGGPLASPVPVGEGAP